MRRTSSLYFNQYLEKYKGSEKKSLGSWTATLVALICFGLSIQYLTLWLEREDNYQFPVALESLLQPPDQARDGDELCRAYEICTIAPSQTPTANPIGSPTTGSPSLNPTPLPTDSPTTSSPSLTPTEVPSQSPVTFQPTTSQPTFLPSLLPTSEPTNFPQTSAPTESGCTGFFC